MKIAISLVTFVKSHKILSILFGLTILSSIIVPAILFTLILPVYDEPIEILSDEDFLKYDYILGNGTFDAPYIIESRKIVSDTSRYGIYIDNTTAFFIIRKCEIDVYSKGIYLKDNAPRTAIIEDNEITVASYSAIQLAYTSGVLVRNNLITDCFLGLYVYNCEFIDVYENEFENTTVEINYSDNCTFTNNLIQDYRRVAFQEINNISVDNNKFYDGTRAIDLNNNLDLVLTNNEIENRGLHLYSNEITDYNSYVVENNTIAGLPFGFFINLNNLIISEKYGQLLFYNCSSSVIKDQKFTSISETIRAYSCSNLSFMNIEIISGEIYCRYSPLSSYNNISITGGHLQLYSCPNSSVEFSYIASYAEAVVELINSPNSRFENNVVVNSSNEYAHMPKCCVTHGVYFYQSYDSTLINNSFINSGLSISSEEIQTFEIYNNTVDGFPLGVFLNESHLVLSERYGQLFLIACDDVLIENQEITTPVTAITVVDCTNLLIKNSIFDRYTPAIGRLNAGILLYSCTNVTVEECDFQYRAVAVAARTSNNLFLLSNYVISGDQGFDVRDSDYCLIQDNHVIGGHNVIELHTTNNTTITNNTLDNCEWNGIKVTDCSENLTISFNLINCNKEECDYGIFFDNVNGSIVLKNLINSSLTGLYLRDSSLNIISNCTFQYCLSYAIILSTGSHFNEVFFNNFIQNNLEGSSHAYDENNDNCWYSVVHQIGNYWDNLDDEQIYVIDGSTEQKDEYPVHIPFS